MTPRKPFHLFNDRGFSITLENGFVISVQFAPLNYCESEKDFQDLTATNAEIAIWHNTSTVANGKFLTKGIFKCLYGIDIHDDVVGYVSPDKIIIIAEYLRTLNYDDQDFIDIIYSKSAFED